jgi:hypothetical protein
VTLEARSTQLAALRANADRTQRAASQAVRDRNALLRQIDESGVTSPPSSQASCRLPVRTCAGHPPLPPQRPYPAPPFCRSGRSGEIWSGR